MTRRWCLMGSTIGDRLEDRRRLASAMRARGLLSRGEQIDLLTPREHEVMRLRAKGLTNEEVGGIMGISPATVRTHCRGAFARLDVSRDSVASPSCSTFLRALLMLGWLQVPDR